MHALQPHQRAGGQLEKARKTLVGGVSVACKSDTPRSLPDRPPASDRENACDSRLKAWAKVRCLGEQSARVTRFHAFKEDQSRQRGSSTSSGSSRLE